MSLSQVLHEISGQVQAMDNDTLLTNLTQLIEDSRRQRSNLTPDRHDLVDIGGTALYRAMIAAENRRRIEAGEYGKDGLS